MKQRIVFGSDWLEVELPDDAAVVRPGGVSLPLAPVADLAAAVERALEHPVDGKPLRERVKPGARVLVAFDDPTVVCFAPVWETALPILVAELERAGVREDDVTFVCANALHRQFTHSELASVLGAAFVGRHGARLRCHDAEDPDGIVHLGTTAHGYHVELNRLVADSDLTVYLNCATTHGFNGGWKSVCVGLSTWKSIRHHHTPELMSMSLVRNRMHEILDEMGALVDDRLGAERIFKLETVLANPMQVAHVFAGSTAACRRATLAELERHHTARRDLVREKTDVVVYGIPEWSPYAAFSSMNPLLTLLSTGLGYLGGMIEALGKPGCSVILATPCPDTWDEARHPSYREVYERVLGDTREPAEIMERYETDFAGRADYLERYRHGFGFHPIHGLLATHPLKRLRHAGRVFVAGIGKPEIARHLGFEPAATVEDALAAARAIHGPPSVACVTYPPAFIRR